MSMPISPVPTPPKMISPMAMFSIAIAAAKRREAVVGAVDGAAGGVGGDVGEQRGAVPLPKRTSLPSMLPPDWVDVTSWLDAGLGDVRVAGSARSR